MSQIARQLPAIMATTRITHIATASRIVNRITVRGMANRFNRRPAAAPAAGALAKIPTALVSAPLAGVRIEGEEAQVAQVRLRAGVAYKVDPGSIISVPQGVEVKACYGAPQAEQQPQMQQQQQPASGVGGLLSRLRNTPQQQQQQQEEQLPTAPMLAELSLQLGQPMPEESIQLGPSTAARLHTVSLDDFGGEIYISRGSFLAAPATVNIHSVDEPTNIPGLVLQRIDGVGSVILKVAGQAMPKDLAPGEQLYAQSNRIVAVESSVQILGGQGLLVTLVGPGRIVLQSLPSMEVALTQQAEQTAQVMQASGMAPSGGMISPFGMGSSMGMGGGLGAMVVQGMAFGVGSAIAHSAVNSMFGGGSHASSAAPAAAPESAPDSSASSAPQDGEMHNDLGDSNSGGGDGGGFFGGMFGGDEDGGDEGGDSDW